MNEHQRETGQNKDQRPGDAAEPSDLVPGAGKHAARPSEAEHLKSLHQNPVKGGEDRPVEGGLSGIA